MTERTAPKIPRVIPAAVVIDKRDGYVFWRGPDGRAFTEASATRFAALRNAEMKPDHRDYAVYTLTEAGTITEAGIDQWHEDDEQGMPDESVVQGITSVEVLHLTETDANRRQYARRMATIREAYERDSDGYKEAARIATEDLVDCNDASRRVKNRRIADQLRRI